MPHQTKLISDRVIDIVNDPVKCQLLIDYITIPEVQPMFNSRSPEVLTSTEYTKPKMKNSESKLQRSCIRWFDLQYANIRQLLFAIPNGGKRGIITAKIMKAEGVRPGIPDLFLAIPKLPYSGLFIEMKSEGGRLRPDQKQFIEQVENNYKCVVCRTFESFRDAINDYLNLE